MRLDHEFTVPAPLEEVWQAVIDPERVAPCMPGAALTKVEGDSFTGTVKVKLGPISLLYKGSGEFLEKDEADRKVVIKASGKDSRGGGTAAATVTVTLSSVDGGTHGAVASDIAITGRPAQFGRGLISEVGGKLLDTFAGNLADSLRTDSGASAGAPGSAAASAGSGSVSTAQAAAAAPAAEAAAKGDLAEQSAADTAEAGSQASKPQLRSVSSGGSTGETEPIDLLDYAGQSVAKRLIPVAAGAAVLFVVFMIIRALRRR